MKRMTTNFNRDNDDNVTNLIEKFEEKLFKSPRYQSIHKERTKSEIAKAKSSHKTLGLPKVSLNSPSEYLKKGSHSSICRPKNDHVHYRILGYQHNLPKWTLIKKRAILADGHLQEIPRNPIEMGRLNFRKQNIKNVKNYVAKPTKLKFVHTRHGDNVELVDSGLIPTYIHKKNFGEIPSYLRKNAYSFCPEKKDEDSGQQQAYDKSCRYVTQQEKDKLIKSMKKQWSEIMKTFQCLPFLIDTVPKIKRKLKMEQKLKQLEKDIDLLEQHRYIYVYDDTNCKNE